jgi:hypothetical protein
MRHSKSSEQQLREIKNELAQLFIKQAEFYRKGGRAKHSASDIAEFDK